MGILKKIAKANTDSVRKIYERESRKDIAKQPDEKVRAIAANFGKYASKTAPVPKTQAQMGKTKFEGMRNAAMKELKARKNDGQMLGKTKRK